MSAEGAASCQKLEHVFLNLPKLLCELYPLANISRKNEALILALHVLMLETEFVPKDVPEDKTNEMLPSTWNNNGVIKVVYFHKSCPEFLNHVTYVVMESFVVVYGNVMGTHSSENVNMKADSYINTGDGFADPKCVYRNFQKLSQFFKDEFAFALLADLEYTAGVEPSFGLAGLPMDLQFHILSYLPMKNLVSMSGVNKEFNKLANSSFLWKKLFLRDFSDDAPMETDEQHEWRELYRESHRRKVTWSKRLPSWTPLPEPPGLRFPDPFIPPFRPYDPRPNLGIPPEIQEAFPHLARRSRSPFFQDVVRDPWHPAFRFF